MVHLLEDLVFRRLFPAVAVLAVLSLVTIVPAGAGGGPSIQVVKVPVGPVPDGTVFTIKVTCDDGKLLDTRELTFPAAGGTQTTTFQGISFDCTVTETDDGGAQTVAYECEVIVAGNEPVCESDQEVSGTGGGSVTRFTVTNTFADIAPADAAADDVVQATPTFTG